MTISAAMFDNCFVYGWQVARDGSESGVDIEVFGMARESAFDPRKFYQRLMVSTK